MTRNRVIAGIEEGELRARLIATAKLPARDGRDGARGFGLQSGRSHVLAIAALAALACTSPSSVQAQARPSAASAYLENLTPDNSVFVAVDYLTGFQPAIRTMDRNLYQNNLSGLAETVQIFNLPTIVLGDEGPPRGKFMPQMGQFFSHATYVARHSPSAWREPAFVSAVAATGRHKLVFAGISIDNCTMLTALDAMRAGYQVYFVTDVSGAESDLIERSALTRLVQAGAIPVTWVSFGSELLVAKGGWPAAEGKRLGEIYAKHTLYFQQ